MKPHKHVWKNVFQTLHHTTKSIFQTLVGDALMPVIGGLGRLFSGKGRRSSSSTPASGASATSSDLVSVVAPALDNGCCNDSTCCSVVGSSRVSLPGSLNQPRWMPARRRRPAILAARPLFFSLQNLYLSSQYRSRNLQGMRPKPVTQNNALRI